MDAEILGPIDYLVMELPTGHLTGEAFDRLREIADNRTVRVLDLEFVAKSETGSVKLVALSEVEPEGHHDVRRWEGLSSGLLDQADLERVGSAIDPGSLAVVLVYENLWAVPLLAALDHAGANLIGQGRIIPEDLVDQLDATETS
ncbi:DUF6325 family protein [Streptacidiphilus jiangxiensis]|uniref:DUF1269 domain-containing protein n=1 Tax=Streptacidiphilus jiangxiensis TaxID=235985 RepID=A0A1H7WGF9_STRJI|nr:DUF6325 family protein [Streptacidiphilus jiangxiensis]SEM20108.1 hypothetical protein SAMN05414137_120120 [Streptacidiphilus jiangxiensis]